MRLKQKLSALISTTLVVAGGVAAYYYLKVQPATLGDPLAAAQVLPNSVVMATYITTAPKAWSTLQTFGTPAAQAAMSRNWVALQPDFLQQVDLSYEADIRPWINGLMLAVVPAPAAASLPMATWQPLLLVGIRDRVKALQTANKLRTIAGVTITEIPLSGVTLTEITTPRGTTFTAVLGDFLAVSPYRSVIEQAIAAYRGEQPTWASQTEVTALLSQDWRIETPLIRLYLPNYAAVQQQMLRVGPPASAPLPNFPAEEVQSIAVGIGTDAVGLRFQAITQLRESAPGVDYQPALGQVLAYFPSKTIAVMSGQNLHALWATLSTLSADARPTRLPALLREQSERWGIDLTQVKFDWMNGEFGLGAIALSSDASTQRWGSALVLEVRDRAAAEVTLDHLNTLAAASGYQVRSGTLGDRPVTTWQQPQDARWLGYGWQDPNFLFVALSGGPKTLEQLALAPTQPLRQQQRFRSLTQALPSPNAGYIYLDVEQLTTLLQLNLTHGGHAGTLVQWTPLLPTDAIALLDVVQGIGLTMTWPQPRRGEVTMVIALKRQNSNDGSRRGF
ncbi:DUF3352 domain-containing protein [Trichothermofontia sp.]